MIYATEDDFQRHLDECPDDHFARLVFADWLQDRDDSRADGYRVLGAHPVFPWFDKYSVPWGAPEVKNGVAWCWWGRTVDPGCLPHCLPDDWFDAVKSEFQYKASYQEDSPTSKDFYTRREADDAAALAFAKLPADRRTELLAGKAVAA